MPDAKPYVIPKRLVWDAYQRVKANQGAAGVDGESVAAFEADLKNNLYKVWNRMSSGSYFPPPVRLVEIPKDDGGMRPLGIPTVADRVAQTVVKMVLEPLVDPHFHPDSYGYRPGKSALDAVGTARQRCWATDWVIDLDIKGFFDSIPHDLVERAVAHHTDLPWVRLYIARWLRAPVQRPDGTLEDRTKGTPQGGVISPVLANLFLHYVFDAWLQRTFPRVPFERYADDAIVHCKSEPEARTVLDAIRRRFEQCGLALHPTKTRIVYCKDANRPGEFEHVSFDFLGYTFRPRRATNPRGKPFLSFLPAMSAKAAKKIRHTVRAWRRLPTSPTPGGGGSSHQPGGAWVGELLRPVLSVAVRGGAPSRQSRPGRMGPPEVQTVSPTTRGRRGTGCGVWPVGRPSSSCCGRSGETVRWRGRAG